MDKSIKSDSQAQKHTDVDRIQCISTHTAKQRLCNLCFWNSRGIVSLMGNKQLPNYSNIWTLWPCKFEKGGIYLQICITQISFFNFKTLVNLIRGRQIFKKHLPYGSYMTLWVRLWTTENCILLYFFNPLFLIRLKNLGGTKSDPLLTGNLFKQSPTFSSPNLIAKPGSTKLLFPQIINQRGVWFMRAHICKGEGFFGFDWLLKKCSKALTLLSDSHLSLPGIFRASLSFPSSLEQ